MTKTLHIEVPIIDELLMDKDVDLGALTKLIHASLHQKVHRALYQRKRELIAEAESNAG